MTFGELRAVVAGGPDREGGGEGPVVVLMHGFGATGQDLVPLWREIIVPRATRFVFPAAPLVIGSFGPGLESRAWWRIDVVALEQALREGRERDLSREIPEGLAEARSLVRGALDAIEADLRPPPGGLVLGGFSQGAMLALDVALHDPRPLAGLALMSGTSIAEPLWAPRMASRAGLPIFQSHGTLDPLLPFRIAERLRDRLAEAGAVVEFVAFRGGHEIPPVVVRRLGAFLERVLGPWVER
jgi:phospholipase/carboxylesterase